jgi:hypothetical protein
LERNLTDVDIEDSDDSRGLVLRAANHIMKKDPQAKISVSYFDIALDNIRDLLRYIKKDGKKGNSHSFFEEQKHAYSHNQSDANIPQTHVLEKEFVEIHERPHDDYGT